LRRIANDLGVGNGRRIETGFVGARVEQTAHIFNASDTTTHCEGNENLRGYRLNDVKNQIAAIAGGSDVQEGEFIGALFVVPGRYFDGVACVAKFYKINAFDHTAARDVKARNDAFG
jgi:hypothetical protein